MDLCEARTEALEERGDLGARGLPLRQKPDRAVDLGAVEDAERDRIGHRIARPAGDLRTVRVCGQVGRALGAADFEHLVRELGQQHRDLLARHGDVGREGRGRRTGDDAGLIRPEDRVLIPVLRQVGERCAAGNLRLADEVIEDLHDLRARVVTPSGAKVVSPVPDM